MFAASPPDCADSLSGSLSLSLARSACMLNDHHESKPSPIQGPNQAAKFGLDLPMRSRACIHKAGPSMPAIRRQISRMLRPRQLQVLLEEDHTRIYLLHRRGLHFVTSLWGGPVHIYNTIGVRTAGHLMPLSKHQRLEPHYRVSQRGRTDLRAQVLTAS